MNGALSSAALWLVLATSALGCAASRHAPPPKVTDLSIFDIPHEPAEATVATSPSAATPSLAARPKATIAESAPEWDLSASSTYQGWPLENATDGNRETSWYSDTGDSVAKGKSPFFQVALRSPRTLRRVAVLGNRDPSYFDGFGILRGQLDVFDADGRLIESLTANGAGDRRDYVFELHATTPAKTLRFTSLRDQGDRNIWGDVAIGELQVQP